jgi:hypothetical protein
VVDWPGLGVDFVNASGARAGFEFGQSLGFAKGQAGRQTVEPIAIFTNYFVQGGRQ